MKKIIILGSTGSIGKQTLEIIKKDKNKFKVLLLSTDKNSPEYLYTNKRSLACFLDGSINLKSASWGSSVGSLISNDSNFE